MITLKEIFHWEDPKLFTRESIVRRCLVLFLVIITTVSIGIESYGVYIIDDLLRGYFAIDETRKAWFGSLFLIGFFIPCTIFSYFSTRFSHKTCYAAGLIIFFVGCTLGGIATEYYEALLSRVITGIGAGVMASDGQLLLQKVVAKRWFTRVNIIYASLFGMTVACGMLIGGYIGQTTHWRLVFFFDSFIALTAFFILWITFKDVREGLTKEKVDILGLFYLLSMLISMVIFISQVKAPWNTAGWRSAFTFAWILSSLIFFICFIHRCKTAKAPIVRMDLFKSPDVTLGALGSFVGGVILFGCNFSFITLLQQSIVYERIVIGLVMCSFGIAFVAGGISFLLVKYIRPIYLAIFGLTLIAIGCFCNHALTFLSEPIDIIFYLVLRGFGCGLATPALLWFMSEKFEKQEEKAAALDIGVLFQRIGGSLGTSTMTVIITMRQAYHELRFGEQVDIASPRYKQVLFQSSLFLEDKTLGSKSEELGRARDAIINNIIKQANIASFADTFFLIGWLTVAVVILMCINEWLSWYRRSYVVKPQIK